MQIIKKILLTAISLLSLNSFAVEPQQLNQKLGTPAEAKDKKTPEQLKQLESDSKWMMFYYQNPKPNEFTKVIKSITKDPNILKGNGKFGLIAFMSEIFKTNPSKTNEWCSEFKTLDESNKFGIAIAINNSQIANAKECIKSFNLPESLNQQIANGKIFDFATLSGTHPAHLDMWWGAFMATGNKLYATKVVDISLQPTISKEKNTNVSKEEVMKLMVIQAAQWSTASMAKEHPIVKEIVTSKTKK